MNWFLYIVNEPIIHEDNIINAGDAGVGRCSMDPGMMEAPYGIMYVIPHSYVVEYHKHKKQRRPCASIVRDAVEEYFGVSLKNHN